MRWEDERYVRLYTRNTVDWNMWPWQSRALFPLLLRQVDRAGLLDLGKHGVAGLAETVRLPPEVVEPGLSGLITDGCVERRGSVLVMRSFIEAQEAPSTDAQRKRDQREKDRARSKFEVLTGQEVTNRDQESQSVTKSHIVLDAVTIGHSVPIRSEPPASDSLPPPARVEEPKNPEPVKSLSRSAAIGIAWAKANLPANGNSWEMGILSDEVDAARAASVAAEQTDFPSDEALMLGIKTFTDEWKAAGKTTTYKPSVLAKSLGLAIEIARGRVTRDDMSRKQPSGRAPPAVKPPKESQIPERRRDELTDEQRQALRRHADGK